MTKQQAKTRWHRLLGKLLEELLTPTGITVLTDVPILSEPPEADILLLRREHNRWTQEQKARLPDGIRDTIAGNVLLEFKYTESVNEKAFQQTICYDYLYKAAQEMKSHEVQTFLVSSKTPRETTLQEFGYLLAEKPGVYHSKYPVLKNIPLILLNDLSDEPHNAWIKCFASRKTEKQSAFNTLNRLGISLFGNRLKWIIEGLLYYLFNKGNEDMEELTPEKIMEYGKKWQNIVLSGIEPDDILSKFSIKDIIKRLDKDDVLKEFAPEERLKGLAPEERLKGLAPEEIEEYLKKLKKKSGK